MEKNSLTYGVGWSQRFGAECPACGCFTKEAYKHGPWRMGYKERYHVCPNPECRHRFKSIAEDAGSRECVPDPEKLVYLRQYNGKCGGVMVNQQMLLPMNI